MISVRKAKKVGRNEPFWSNSDVKKSTYSPLYWGATEDLRASDRRVESHLGKGRESKWLNLAASTE